MTRSGGGLRQRRRSHSRTIEAAWGLVNSHREPGGVKVIEGQRITAVHSQGRVNSLKIFVIGTGRSGTHWLGHILDSHPAISTTFEAEGIFEAVTEMALDPSKKPKLLPSLLHRYETEHARARPRHYADKSHPNLWIAEDLADAFREAVFIGIQRDAYATVASMLRHAGVTAWHDRWREFPLPNAFLGIRVEHAQTYDSLSHAAKCALRWKAHAERMQKMKAVLGRRLLVVSYESLVREPDVSVRSIQAFLGLERSFPAPAPLSESLGKWRLQLSNVDIDEIRSAVGHHPQEWRM